jgi:hypothetical protein
VLTRITKSCFVIFFIIFSSICYAEQIEDNSFLLEEAYNQEEGVVQFIQSIQSSKKPEGKFLNYSFTNEIPIVNQNHQFSYVIPLNKSSLDSTTQKGIGDILLNYRYQLLNNETTSIAPRLSAILPTGNRSKGFGNSTFGTQTNIAMSTKLNSSFVSHWNIGFTYLPRAKGQTGEGKADLFSTNFGASIVYLLDKKFNFLVEFVQNSTESSNGDSTKSRTETYVVNPGLRFSIDYTNTQIVPGISFPIGIGPSKKDDFSVLAYLSIESKLW